MKEQFVITTGTKDYDSNIDELNMYYTRQKFAYGMMLIGAILVLVALI